MHNLTCRQWFSGLSLAALMWMGVTVNCTSAETKTNAPVIFMIGDSTMSNKPLFPPQPERGWGQLLPLYFTDSVHIHNLAMNGRSSKSFRSEGRWKPVMELIRPGDYVIIQFSHNDQKDKDPRRFTEAFGSFKENLARYVQETREKQGRPILATPIVRRKFNGTGELNDTHGDYAVAIRQVAKDLNVPLLDLQKRSAELIEALGPDRSKMLFMWFDPGEFEKLPQGRKDDTHLNAFGASRICDLATDELRTASPDLAQWLRSKP